jgi:2-oxoglutarate ferredoxin oxidoreductase subunit alpha
MAEPSITILVGGEAGQGLVTVGELMAKALVRAGYDIVVTQDYQSRIRGGHNTFAIRAGPGPVLGPGEQVDILVALNAETVERHRGQLKSAAVVVADEAIPTDGLPAGVQTLKVPLRTLAPKPLFDNVAALGVLGSAVCNDIGILEGLIRQTFGKKGAEIVEENLKVLRAAYAWVRTQDFVFACMPPPAEGRGGRLMLHGNEAIALGALAAGCNFLSFYPMTPGTSVAIALIDKGRTLGFVAEQAEDEIAAVNMAIGASFAGARSVVTTSGGGFALMVEAVSLAAMIETPLVIVLVQRPGPATGLPTRTEQADLNLALYAGHGEFPRAILTPGTVEECFHLTHRAFDLAERFQGPMFVLSDQFLADSFRAVEPFDLTALPAIPEPVVPADPASYRRFEVTGDGVSPRAVPGASAALVRVDSDEHTPEGFITEDPAVRLAQADKRLRKGLALAAETMPPEHFGEDAPELLLVCWGSTLGACLEAAERLAEQGKKAAVLHFKQVWPLSEAQFLGFLESAGTVVAVEGNATGQFARLVRQETGFTIENLILRYDGYPLTAGYILKGLAGIG